MPDALPPLVRSYRSDIVETIHRGAVAVVDASGKLVAHVGDPEVVYLVRSSGKPLQAVAAAEAGAFERFGYTEAQVALAAASHSGEVAHVAEIDSTLGKLGLTENDLVCPPAYPLNAARRDEMIRAGEPPTRRHHNCSGKHCAMLAAALARDEEVVGYWRPEHPHQRRIVGLLAQLGDLSPRRVLVAEDGCGVPVQAMPLRSVALAFARLADPSGLPTPRREACEQVARAMVAYPYLVSGSERLDMIMLAVGAGRWVCKGGALGYFAAGVFPGEENRPGLGIALKIEDGYHQAACQVAVETFRQLGLLSDEQFERLRVWHAVSTKNSRGKEVATSRPEFELVSE
jgi:L-asparaginase II